MSFYTYLGSPVNGKGLADDSTRLNSTKVNQKLGMLRAVLISKVVSVTTRV